MRFAPGPGTFEPVADHQAGPGSWQALCDFAEVVAAPMADQRAADDMADLALREAGLPEMLDEALRSGSELVIVLNDEQRGTRSDLALAAFYRAVDRLGSRLRTRLVLATGTHRASEAAQRQHVQRVAGAELHRLAGVIWHDARARRRLRDVGGVAFNREVAEAQHVFVVGSCEPHYFAGITGAHKTLAIGTLSYDGIQDNHAAAVHTDAQGLVLQGNPVHDDICSKLDVLGNGRRILALNQLLVSGDVAGWAAGSPRDALDALRSRVHATFSYEAGELFDVVVAEVSPPLDASLYQADKGIKNTEAAVRDGGVLILDAGCDGGVGADAFVAVLRQCPDLAATEALLAARGYRLGDHKALRIRRLQARGVSIGIVSPGLESLDDTGLHLFRHGHEAWSWARDIMGSRPPKALLVRDAGNRFVTRARGHAQ